MSTLTRHLPWFVKDLGVSIIGNECYVTLVEKLQFHDVVCVKYALSKGLGVCIVVGGSIMKVPQIVLIVSARSASGLSLPAYIIETLSYAITLVYSYRYHYPFSTYGENLFLTIQNTVITFLIIRYAPMHNSNTGRNLLATTVTAATAIALVMISLPILSLLQLMTLPLSLFSKLPQIRQNARARSTGQLSTVAVISQIAGCLARLFTTATEVDDSLVSMGFALALILNIILGFQMWAYWGRDADLLSERERRSEDIIDEYPLSAVDKGKGRASEPSTPPQASAALPRTGGRKWTRKVD